MKGLMAKLKGMQIKRMLVAHGEKFVFGTVGLIVLLALMSTTWGGYQEQPEVLLTKATAAGAALSTGNWPEEKQAEFKPSTYQNTAQMMFEELNVPDAPSPFSYDKFMSFPIYAREEPRSEPDFQPPQYLLADGDRIVLGVNPPEPTEEEWEKMQAEMNAFPDQGRLGGPAAGKGKGGNAKGGNAKGGKGRKGDEDGMLMPGPVGIGAMDMAVNSTGLKPRGQRMVALRGIVNLYDIGLAIQKALHLPTAADGMALVDVVDFKIQRQKAVAGPNPWPEETWQDITLDRAAEVLSECGQAADIVISECINPVFTMPLPTRLDGDYTTLVSHPSLERFELTKEQREMEQALNSAFLDEAAEMGINDLPGTPKGFLKFQVNINEVKNEVMGRGGNMDRIRERAGYPGGAGGAAGVMPGAGARPPMGPRAGGMMPGGPAGGMGRQGMGEMGGMQMQVGDKAAGYLMLFRYLDFDVNPGDAYRYRVKLEFINPNFGMALDKIKEASVAEGETRQTQWSEPSAPVVVKPDSAMFLTDVDRRNSRNRGEAKIQAYQWDPSLGTYIDSKLVARYGQFLGGLATSVRLDLGIPAYEEKEVLFATKEFLVDTSVPPMINPAENPDLQLVADPKQPNKRFDLPAEAILIDEYGQLKVLDSITQKSTEKVVEKKVAAEREPWKYLEESEQAEGTLDDPAAARGEMMRPGGPSSALKRGGRGGRTGRGGAEGDMPGMPGAAGGRGGRRGGR